MIPIVRFRHGQTNLLVTAVYSQLLRLSFRFFEQALYGVLHNVVTASLVVVVRKSPMDEDQITFCLDRSERVYCSLSLGHDTWNRLVVQHKLESIEPEELLHGIVSHLKELLHEVCIRGEADDSKQPALGVQSVCCVLAGERGHVVDSNGVWRSSWHDWSLRNSNERLEHLWRHCNRRIALCVLQAVADEPRLRDVEEDDGVDEVSVWIVGVRRSQLGVFTEDGLALVDRMERLSAPEWTLLESLERNRSNNTEVVTATPQGFPEIGVFVFVCVDNVASGQHNLKVLDQVADEPVTGREV